METLPQPLVNSHLLFVFIDFPVLNISLEWSRTIFVLLCPSLSLMFLSHPHCRMYQNFVPFHGWIILCCMVGPHSVYPFCLLMDTWVVPAFWLLWTGTQLLEVGKMTPGLLSPERAHSLNSCELIQTFPSQDKKQSSRRVIKVIVEMKKTQNKVTWTWFQLN